MRKLFTYVAGRLRTVRGSILVACTGLVALTGGATGLSAYWLLSNDLEIRHAEETAKNVGGLLAAARLPSSIRLAKDLASVLSCEILLVDPRGNRLLAASLPAAETAFGQQLAPSLAARGAGTCFTAGGRVYRRAETVVQDAEGGGAAVRVVVLLDRRQHAGLRRLLAWRIAAVTAVVMAGGWMLAVWLAATIARPARRLAAALAGVNPALDDGAGTTEGPPAALGKRRFAPSELRQLEQAFVQMREHLSQARERLARAVQVAASGRLAAAVVHELRNALSGIKMNARVLAETGRAGEMDPSLAVILQEVDRMDHYLTSLQWAAAGAGNDAWPPPSGPQGCLANDTAADALAAVAGRGRHAGVVCTLTPGPPGLRLAAHAEAVRQILVNLLLNAIEASPSGGAVTVEVLSLEAGRARLRVTDHGPGVHLPPGEELFMPFTTTKSHGTGLGLFVCRRLVERYGGQIGGGNVPGGGAAFWIDLPTAGPVSAPPADTDATPPPPNRTARAGP